MSVGRAEKSRLDFSDLKERAQCRHCLHSFPRDSFDWSLKKEVKIGFDDSWGKFDVYSSFVRCPDCNELSVGTEHVSYKIAK